MSPLRTGLGVTAVRADPSEGFQPVSFLVARQVQVPLFVRCRIDLASPAGWAAVALLLSQRIDSTVCGALICQRCWVARGIRLIVGVGLQLVSSSIISRLADEYEFHCLCTHGFLGFR